MTILPDCGYSFEQQLNIQTTGDTQRDQSRDGSSMGEGKYKVWKLLQTILLATLTGRQSTNIKCKFHNMETMLLRIICDCDKRRV